VARGLRIAATVLLIGASWLAPAGGPAAAAGSAAPSGESPNDPLFKYQWHLRAIQAPAAWAVSRGAGATVAILDTGVAYEDRGIYRRAPDLTGTRFVPGWDFVDGDAHPNDEPPPDRQSHGTHIAGIVAQTTGNGLGGAGVAPAAAIMPIRVLRPDTSGSSRAIAKGLRFAADHGANIANLSIAGPSDVPIVKDAIEYAASKGVTIVASAGNDGRASVSFPAAYPEVIAVGALSRSRARAPYSNYGKALDIVAPGGDGQLNSTGDGPADGVLQQTLKGGPSKWCYCYMASTSAAAAQVSGVAALLVASGRASGPGGIASALRSSARDLGPPGWDAQHGAGLLQAGPALEPANSAPGTPATWLVSRPLLVAGAILAAGLFGLSVARRTRRTRLR
jgi:serine protease